jgi:hypothetical protein
MKKIVKLLWAKVVATTVYIMNQTPIVAIHAMTPEKNS